MKAPQLVEKFSETPSINNIIKPSLSQIKQIKPKVIIDKEPPINNINNNININNCIYIFIFIFIIMCSYILYDRYINKDKNQLKYKENINNLYNDVYNYKKKLNQ